MMNLSQQNKICSGPGLVSPPGTIAGPGCFVRGVGFGVGSTGLVFSCTGSSAPFAAVWGIASLTGRGEG